MGIAGAHRALATAVTAALVGGLALSGCSETVDDARTVQTRLGRLHQVVDVEVTTPSPDRAGAITLTYDADTDSAASLAGLVTEVGEVVEDLDYPAYLLTLVPAIHPASALTVDEGFSERAGADDVLETWRTLTDALLGDVTYVALAAGETITVDSQGAAAHDVAEVARIGHGDARTTWVFRSDDTAFTVGARVRPTDAALLQAVQRNAGTAGQPVWVRSWQLDRRRTHVRLDLDVALRGATVAPGALTVARYGSVLAPLARTSLVALAGTGLPAWLRLHHGSDVFASWASDQAPGPGRDPLGRRWDPWLARQAAAVG